MGPGFNLGSKAIEGLEKQQGVGMRLRSGTVSCFSVEQWEQIQELYPDKLKELQPGSLLTLLITHLFCEKRPGIGCRYLPVNLELQQGHQI